MNKSNSFLAISILAAAVIIGGSFIYGNSIKGDSSGATAQVAGDKEIGNSAPVAPGDIIDDDVVLGDKDAPVTVVEFGDYQCPFCKQLYDNSEKRLRDEYVATGKIKWVYRDFPLDSLHPYARSAAEAAECARDQGKYWKYHDVLFENQASIPTMDFVSVAGELGMDTSAFSECVAERKYKDEVEKDYQDGIKLGVRGTPSSFINGKNISGALPYQAFKDAIEEALKS